jgi:hypothetical protein
MNYLLAGAIILAVSLLGLCLHFFIRPHTPRGYDPWIAVAITVGLVLGVGTIVVGILDVTDTAGFWGKQPTAALEREGRIPVPCGRGSNAGCNLFRSDVALVFTGSRTRGASNVVDIVRQSALALLSLYAIVILSHFDRPPPPY